MDRLQQILTSSSDPCEKQNADGVIGFIRFRLEPVVEYFLYIVGMLIILVGAVEVLVVGVKNLLSKQTKWTREEIIMRMRIRFSELITLGLTFILGAEVVRMFRIPNLIQLFRVTLIILLRQLISLFLDKDVQRLRKEFPNIVD